MRLNPMTPAWRRVTFSSALFNLVLFSGLSAFGMWSWATVLVCAGLNVAIVLLWPSNKALIEAEKQKKLTDGGE